MDPIGGGLLVLGTGKSGYPVVRWISHLTGIDLSTLNETRL